MSKKDNEVSQVNNEVTVEGEIRNLKPQVTSMGKDRNIKGMFVNLEKVTVTAEKEKTTEDSVTFKISMKSKAPAFPVESIISGDKAINIGKQLIKRVESVNNAINSNIKLEGDGNEQY